MPGNQTPDHNAHKGELPLHKPLSAALPCIKVLVILDFMKEGLIMLGALVEFLERILGAWSSSSSTRGNCSATDTICTRLSSLAQRLGPEEG
jgi:hypothetical protein